MNCCPPNVSCQNIANISREGRGGEERRGEERGQQRGGEEM